MKIPLSAIHQIFETRSITQSTLGAFLSIVASSNSLISFLPPDLFSGMWLLTPFIANFGTKIVHS